MWVGKKSQKEACAVHRRNLWKNSSKKKLMHFQGCCLTGAPLLYLRHLSCECRWLTFCSRSGCLNIEFSFPSKQSKDFNFCNQKLAIPNIIALFYQHKKAFQPCWYILIAKIKGSWLTHIQIAWDVTHEISQKNHYAINKTRKNSHSGPVLLLACEICAKTSN